MVLEVNFQAGFQLALALTLRCVSRKSPLSGTNRGHDRRRPQSPAENPLRRDAGSPSKRRKQKTSRPSSGGFRLTSALRFPCLLFLGFRLLGRFLWGFLG